MRHFHVLIADPDPLLPVACQLFLVGQEVELTAVANGTAYRQALQRGLPDLLVVDTELPGLDFDELLRAGPDGPPLILTARPEALPGELPHGSQVGVLFKPFSPALLALIVGTIAHSPHFAGAVEAPAAP